MKLALALAVGLLFAVTMPMAANYSDSNNQSSKDVPIRMIVVKPRGKDYDKVTYRYGDSGEAKKVGRWNGDMKYLEYALGELNKFKHVAGPDKKDYSVEHQYEQLLNALWTGYAAAALEKEASNLGFDPNTAVLQDLQNVIADTFVALSGDPTLGSTIWKTTIKQKYNEDMISQGFTGTSFLSRLDKIRRICFQGHLLYLPNTAPNNDQYRDIFWGMVMEDDQHWFENDYKGGGPYTNFEPKEIAKALNIRHKEKNMDVKTSVTNSVLGERLAASVQLFAE